MELHPQFIGKEGKSEFVVLPFDEYSALTELMVDYEDIKDLRNAKEKAKGEYPIPLAEVIAELDV